LKSTFAKIGQFSRETDAALAALTQHAPTSGEEISLASAMKDILMKVTSLTQANSAKKSTPVLSPRVLVQTKHAFRPCPDSDSALIRQKKRLLRLLS